MVSRRTRQWGRFQTDTIVVAGGGAARVEITSLLRARMPSLNNFTIQRVVGTLDLFPGNNPIEPIICGMIKTTVNVTLAEVPIPDADDSSWLWWWGGLIPGLADRPNWRSVAFDNRSARRFPELESKLDFVLENNGASAFTFAINGRILCLLT